MNFFNIATLFFSFAILALSIVCLIVVIKATYYNRVVRLHILSLTDTFLAICILFCFACLAVCYYNSFFVAAKICVLILLIFIISPIGSIVSMNLINDSKSSKNKKDD